MRASGLVAALFTIACSVTGYAQCAFEIHSSLATTQHSSLNFVVSNAPTGVMGDGINVWAYGCEGYATSYPEMFESTTAVNSPMTLNVYVTFDGGVSQSASGACGNTEVEIADGQIISVTTTIWAQQANGTDCAPFYSSIVAHEIGHALGLADTSSSQCDATVMGNYMGAPSADQCDAIDHIWVTEWEEDRWPDDPYCNSYCWTQCYSGNCPDIPPTNCGACSPVLIDLDDDGFDLAGSNETVSFDIDADGEDEMTTWTRRGEGDAFLVLDHNANGRVDDGSELFGTSTLLRSGQRAPNGYVALAEYDAPAAGGNNDGQLNSADVVWSKLRVWIDADHDGVSGTPEVLPLSVAGVEAIRYKYVRLNRTDRYGNIFRFKAKALVRDKHGRVHVANTYDVFFVVEQ